MIVASRTTGKNLYASLILHLIDGEILTRRGGSSEIFYLGNTCVSVLKKVLKVAGRRHATCRLAVERTNSIGFFQKKFAAQNLRSNAGPARKTK